MYSYTQLQSLPHWENNYRSCCHLSYYNHPQETVFYLSLFEHFQSSVISSNTHRLYWERKLRTAPCPIPGMSRCVPSSPRLNSKSYISYLKLWAMLHTPSVSWGKNRIASLSISCPSVKWNNIICLIRLLSR